ncbi:translation initiation factor eIF 4e-like domain-containing protein [Cytidiella melzeri]|nr:translation initiation factor eIF 4e-like domain-containing protein [Cytidiella melzeri]
MGADDDALPKAESYPYFWHTNCELALQDFLKKYKPSMVQDDGTKPWLWVEKSDSPKEDVDMEKAIKEATILLEETTEKVENIKNNASIPIRANKKKGVKSKKELREEAQADATENLKSISVRCGWVSGKWLIFAPPEKVDLIWSTLATSLIEGPLAATCANLAKVSTCPKEETPNYQHVMCLYMPDVYDQDKVTEVMKILLRKHGMNLMGVKSNLYTAIGLDSKHASGIQSTIWKNSALMKDTEIKSLKDEFYAEINKTNTASAEKAAEEKPEAETSSVTKAQPKFKKKAVKNDIFASESEDEQAPSGKPTSKAEEAIKAKAKKPAQKKKAGHEFASDKVDNDELDARKRELQAKKATGNASTKKRAKTESDEDDEDARPTKALKRGGRS